MTACLIGRVEAVLTGRAVSYTRPGTRSAIAKDVRRGSVAVGTEGLDGDEQGDRRYHGGPDKAVHLYAVEHYAHWIEGLGQLPVLTMPGAFGENLSTSGITEEDVRLGDQFRIGSVLMEVSQGRQPCWKLNDRFGVRDMARRVQRSLRTGWYCRVMTLGSLSFEDDIELIARPYPEWPLSRLAKLLYHREVGSAELREALALPLVSSWYRAIERRLSTGKTEDWRARLDGEVAPQI